MPNPAGPIPGLAAFIADLESMVPEHLLPHIAKPEQVAVVMQTTVDALAQDRYRRRGIPHVKIGGRVRYLRTDVLKFLADNRIGGDAA
ncbi:helix-turn-helix domain-containing protein [Mycobacterium marinum]|uniref:helix-turn-helix domain-containing protein n=1 Tax=Mycobacterium marinum TaxID=1781 RepID=UPI00235908A7|nr:helix-turn-helix domain-containing protein [Mycobacterium marinum]MDC8973983.1 helix-turn-helix domain-containing protein [Mycobacterium marinum]